MNSTKSTQFAPNFTHMRFKIKTFFLGMGVGHPLPILNPHCLQRLDPNLVPIVPQPLPHSSHLLILESPFVWFPDFFYRKRSLLLLTSHIFLQDCKSWHSNEEMSKRVVTAMNHIIKGKHTDTWFTVFISKLTDTSTKHITKYYLSVFKYYLNTWFF